MHSGVMSIWLSAISLTKAGSVAQAVPTTDGLTNYAGTTTTRHQLTCGEDPPHVVIREWRYGPRRLRVDDDDEYALCHHWPDFAISWRLFTACSGEQQSHYFRHSALRNSFSWLWASHRRGNDFSVGGAKIELFGSGGKIWWKNKTIKFKV